MNQLQAIVYDQKRGVPAGLFSCCSANGQVLRAVFERCARANTLALVEATANQVDQNGGYTGMTPADFYAFAHQIAREAGLAAERLILGGDHLGPLTWRGLDETEAMRNAETLVAVYVRAGFTKIHLDTSMRLASDDPRVRLPDDIIALRGARLCAAAEMAFRERGSGGEPPVYIIGSEVPIPGGEQAGDSAMSVTDPESCRATLAAYQTAFGALGLAGAWERVIALVVQPGVEFGCREVIDYDREKARRLTEAMKAYPNLVLEGHSTDYQPRENLRYMVEDGIAILKVGPALTFGLREALFALEHIEREVLPDSAGLSFFRSKLDRAMLASPAAWEKHCGADSADAEALRINRLFGYSDRTRYYLPDRDVKAAAGRLIENLRQVRIPLVLLSQYLPGQYAKVRSGILRPDPEALLRDRIGDYVDDYLYAIGAL